MHLLGTGDPKMVTCPITSFRTCALCTLLVLHVCAGAHTLTYTHVSAPTHTRALTYAHGQTRSQVALPRQLTVLWSHAHARTHARTHAPTHTYAHTHARIHTHTHTRATRSPGTKSHACNSLGQVTLKWSPVPLRPSVRVHSSAHTHVYAHMRTHQHAHMRRRPGQLTVL